MAQRVHNFSAGPGALPLEVLQQAQADLVDFGGVGMSLLEMSHRGKIYEQIHHEAISDLRALLGIPENYDVLFMGGGARSQFAFVPMNLLATGQTADYLVTGTWAEGALHEGKKIGAARQIYSSAASGHDHVPKLGDYSVSSTAAYLHYTSNNTIYGTQYHHIPKLAGAASEVPLVCDMSSDILSRPTDISQFGLVYAGAQKNMGPAGVTTVIIRRDLLERSSSDLPEMFSYQKIAAAHSLLNTPPVFAIYMVGLVLKHLLKAGGLASMAQGNQQKAALVYAAIDASNGFYRGHALDDSRSQMNITFRLPSPELEATFVQQATEASLLGLKGHRSVGGIRASIYNAVPLESVQALVQFMAEFHTRQG